MRKFRFFTDFDKEEQWLSDMAKQGYMLTCKLFGYKFERTTPVDAVIKIDYRVFTWRSDFDNYVEMFRDSGWEHIAGTKSAGAQYFRKTEKATSEDIFSDVDSRAGRYRRLSDMWLMLAVCYMPIYSTMIANGTIDWEHLYLTPGLWDKAGADFWRAFLIETPAALFRSVLWLMFPAMIGLFLYNAVRARKQYKKTKMGS